MKLYNFADNHDVNRLASMLKEQQDLFNVYTLLYTMPGIPSIYYGSEWAIEGTKQYGSDAPLRPCLKLQEDTALTKHIATLGLLRKKLPVLFNGSYEQVLLRNEQLVFKRQNQNEEVWVALNCAQEAYTLSLETNEDLHDLLNDIVYLSKDQQIGISIPAKSACILQPIPHQAQETEAPSVKSPDDEKKNEDLPKDTPLGRYQHFKGNHYSVLYVATHSETLEKYVVYRALYGECGVWIRPLSMFCEMVEHEGKKVPRFQYLGK